MHHWTIQYSFLIPLLPLVGAAIAGFFGAKGLKQQSHWPIWLGVGAAAVISISMLVWMVGERHAHPEDPIAIPKVFYTWIAAGGFSADAGFWFDPLTAVMLCVVTGIGFLITVFAKGYMVGESGYFRFFAYLGLFIFMMTLLVMGNNFLMLYLGWEGVGLCSYLLIGYYYDKPAAREAAKKAFLVNRVGDFGFGIGIMLIFLAFGTINYFGGGSAHTGVLEMAAKADQLTEFQRHALQWIPFLLMIGAFGKSAQFPLYVWLPDAMEGPTPVSALIHAATMVTAGVYMIVRCGTLFVANDAAMWTVAAVGAFTALFAATIALRQFDLKKVFAYSTVSQLGFMFVGVGCLAPVAGAFHLVTHAFFKALLFLGSGVVMHAMMGELDMRKMSGLKRVLPMTRWLMLIGCAALAGFPFLSGFFSKDEIILAAWDRSRFLALVMLFTAFLTAYYTFRLYFRVFEGPLVVPPAPPGGHGSTALTAGGHGGHDLADDHAHASASAVKTGDVAHSGVDEHLAHGAHDASHHHNHEPPSMILPLIVLAIGAIVVGIWPGERIGEFLGGSPSLRLAYHVADVHYGLGEIRPDNFGQSEAGEDKEIAAQEHQLHVTFMGISAVISILGIYCAFLMHLRERPAADRLAARFPAITRLLEAKYCVDEIYQNAIVEPLRMLGQAFFTIDQYVVDGIVWMISFVPQLSGFALKLTTQRGYLQGYAATMLLGIAVILLIIFL